MLSIKRFDNWSIYYGKEMNKVVMGELIDKAAVVAEIEGYISNYKDIVAKTDRNDSTWADFVSMIDAKIDVLQHLISFLNTLEVKDTDDAYKQGYNDAIDKACDAYCRLCDTKECGDTGECEWVEKFRKRLMR